MMNTGGPAFPLQTWDSVIHSPKTETGMTLRDYFAAQCLASVMSARMSSSPKPDSVAMACYALADAMLKAREQ